MTPPGSGSIPIRVILDGHNETVLTGSIRIIPVVVSADSTTLSPSNSTMDEEYDYQGAMLFSVLVIGVYAISIVLLIASFIKKKQVLVSVEESKNVNQYLIQVSDLKEKTARENFKKLKRSIIEAVERSDSQGLAKTGDKQSRKNGDGSDTVLKHAILGAGISLYSPLIVIKEETETEDESSSPQIVSVHTSSPSCSSPGSLYPTSGNLTPESPGTGSDHRPLISPPGSGSLSPESPGNFNERGPLISPTGSVYPSGSLTPESPGTGSDRRPLISVRASPPISPFIRPDEGDVWKAMTSANTRPSSSVCYRNASFQPSPSPQTPRRLQKQDSVRSDIWIPQTLRTRTPSPQRPRSAGNPQDNAVSSV